MTDFDDLAGGLIVNMFLCDAAQVAGGKISVLGGGLNMIGPNPQPMAMAIHITVPWDRANMRHQWRLELVDQDGQPVLVRDRPVIANGEFEAGRPAGLRPGSPLSMALAINLAPLPLAADSAFQFRFSIEGDTRPEWAVRFSTRPAPVQQPR